MSKHNRKEFSTKDKDNDLKYLISCAEYFMGAWWYEECLDANLNGLYLKGDEANGFATGISWIHWHGYYYSLQFTEMKMKPVYA